MAEPSGELAGHELETLRSGLRIMALRALGDPDAAEEVAQESLARTIAALRNGKGPQPEKLGAFVAGIARHVIADVHRARQRTVPLDTVAAGPRANTEPDPLAP